MSYGRVEVPVVPLIIYGAGGMARELAWLAESCPEVGVLMAFLDDDAQEHGRHRERRPRDGAARGDAALSRRSRGRWRRQSPRFASGSCSARWTPGSEPRP